MILRLLSLLLGLVLFSACTSEPSQDQGDHQSKSIEVDKFIEMDKIEYRFRDGSVPPEYYRSYTIVADKDAKKVSLSIDSYSDVLLEKEFALTEEQFLDLQKALVVHDISLREELDDKDACDGGTRDAIRYFLDEEKIFSASTYNCRRQSYGDLSGDVNGFALKMRALIPNFSELLGSTRE